MVECVSIWQGGGDDRMRGVCLEGGRNWRRSEDDDDVEVVSFIVLQDQLTHTQATSKSILQRIKTQKNASEK